MGIFETTVRGVLKWPHGICNYHRCLFTKASLFSKNINVCIEGNIGCGKTTSLQHFKPFERFVEIQEEPVQRWRDMGGKNILALRYEDPSRWAFTLQSYIMLTLLQQHRHSQAKPIRLMERSVYSARYFFTENLYNTGHLTDMEYQILQKLFDWEMKTKPVNIDLMIYLQTSPEVCLERIKARRRPEEQIVSLEYLRDLHNLHEKYLIHGEWGHEFKPQILVLNNDHDRQTMETKFHEVVCDILGHVDIPPKPIPVTVTQATG